MKIIGLDKDGVLTASPVHFGSRSRLLMGAWDALGMLGIGQMILAHTEPREWMCEWVRRLHAAGQQIRIITAPGRRYERTSGRWLEAQSVPYDHLIFCDPRNVVAEKAAAAAVCDWYIDNEQELLVGMRGVYARQGISGPRLLNSTREQRDIVKLGIELR